jgi:hypothetical protein
VSTRRCGRVGAPGEAVEDEQDRPVQQPREDVRVVPAHRRQPARTRCHCRVARCTCMVSLLHVATVHGPVWHVTRAALLMRSPTCNAAMPTLRVARGMPFAALPAAGLRVPLAVGIVRCCMSPLRHVAGCMLYVQIALPEPKQLLLAAKSDSNGTPCGRVATSRAARRWPVARWTGCRAAQARAHRPR